jgi:RHH-type proline utilization regulon transcriptional repressor/proline dehydrogenase/delta 1-pyrroline-5-carboxylate dehydrogenase
MLDLREVIYPQFATHNALTVATIIEMAQDRSGFEFQRLHGMGDVVYESLSKSNDRVPCRIYAPVGRLSRPAGLSGAPSA